MELTVGMCEGTEVPIEDSGSPLKGPLPFRKVHLANALLLARVAEEPCAYHVFVRALKTFAATRYGKLGGKIGTLRLLDVAPRSSGPS